MGEVSQYPSLACAPHSHTAYYFLAAASQTYSCLYQRGSQTSCRYPPDTASTSPIFHDASTDPSYGRERSPPDAGIRESKTHSAVNKKDPYAKKNVPDGRPPPAP